MLCAGVELDRRSLEFQLQGERSSELGLWGHGGPRAASCVYWTLKRPHSFPSCHPSRLPGLGHLHLWLRWLRQLFRWVSLLQSVPQKGTDRGGGGGAVSDFAMVTTPFWLRPFNAFSIKSDVSTWHSGLLAINTHSYCVQPPLPKTLQLSWAIYNLSHSPRGLCCLLLPHPVHCLLSIQAAGQSHQIWPAFPLLGLSAPLSSAHFNNHLASALGMVKCLRLVTAPGSRAGRVVKLGDSSSSCQLPHPPFHPLPAPASLPSSHLCWWLTCTHQNLGPGSVPGQVLGETAAV